MIPDIDADRQVPALLALINVRLGAMATPRHAYTYATAPRAGSNFVSIGLSRRYGGNGRGGLISPSFWRLTTRAVGEGDTNARVLLREVARAVEGMTITLDGVTSTPIAFENEDEIRQDDTDDNLWSGLRAWTYAF